MDQDEQTDRIDLHRADAYGRSFTDVYDRWYDGVTDADATARFVADRCGRGPIVELGVGSGRLAVPLVEAGVEVVGLDASPTMLARCPPTVAGSSGSPPIHRVLADMRALPLRGPLPGVLIAFNTLFNLADEHAQRQLLAEVTGILAPDGVVIIEALDGTVLADESSQVPSIGVRDRTHDQLVVTATTVDTTTQTMLGQHLEIDDTGITARPWLLRWLTPNQLDELATDAGLVLAERFGDWDRRAFDKTCDVHVSVYVAR